jgi:hypothetical protein
VSVVDNCSAPVRAWHDAGVTVDEFFAGHPFAGAVFDRVREVASELGEYELRVGKSQVAFRRARGFAYVWIPGRHLRNPDADVVLSIPLGRHVDSPRFKEVAHPSPKVWMHHLEVYDLAEIDDQVRGWLSEARRSAR